MSERVEKIMQYYPQMVMERNCLENQIRNFKGISEEELIDTLYFSHPDGERVQTSGVSEKTSNIALTYKNKMQRINNEWIELLERRYFCAVEELCFFESAVSALGGILPDFISDMVVGGLTWDELMVKYHISRTMVAKYRRKAIRELDILYASHDREIASGNKILWEKGRNFKKWFGIHILICCGDSNRGQSSQHA